MNDHGEQEDNALFEPPNVHEAELINEFSEQAAALEIFQRAVASSAYDILFRRAHHGNVAQNIASLFNELNGHIERHLQEKIDKFESWSPSQRQPRILARSVGNCRNLDIMISRAFGIVSKIRSKYDYERQMLDFLYSLFLNEVEIRREAESFQSSASVVKTLEEIAKSISTHDGRIDLSAKDRKFCPENGIPLWVYLKEGKGSSDKVDRYGYRSIVNSYEAADALDVFAAATYGPPVDIEEFNGRWGTLAHPWQHVTRDAEDSFPISTINLSAEIDKNYRAIYKINARKFIEYRLRNLVNSFTPIIDKFDEEFDSAHYGISRGFKPHDNNSFESVLLKYIIEEDLDNYKNNDDLNRSKTDEDVSDTAIDEALKSVSADASVEDRLLAIDNFVLSNPGFPVSRMIVKLFPAITIALPLTRLPTMAPETWPDDRQEVNGKLETPPVFIKRVYGEWEGRGLTKKLIKELDPTLYRALYNWLQRGNEMPADLDLPTIVEQNDRVVDSVLRQSGAEGHTFAAREMARVQAALRRRHQKE